VFDDAVAGEGDWPMRAMAWPNANRAGFSNAAKRTLHGQVLGFSAPSPACLARTSRPRRWTRMLGMSILTGQASWQAPHRLEAKGREAVSAFGRICGVTMAPIGPWYMLS